MFGFFKKKFIGLLSVFTIQSFSRSLLSNFQEPIKCVYLTNLTCQPRPTLVDMNPNETFLFVYRQF